MLRICKLETDYLHQKLRLSSNIRVTDQNIRRSLSFCSSPLSLRPLSPDMPAMPASSSRRFALAAAGTLEELAQYLRTLVSEDDDAELIASVSDFPRHLSNATDSLAKLWHHVNVTDREAAVAAACHPVPPAAPSSEWRGKPDPAETRLLTLAGNTVGSVGLHSGSLWWHHFNLHHLLDLWEARGPHACSRARFVTL